MTFVILNPLGLVTPHSGWMSALMRRAHKTLLSRTLNLPQLSQETTVVSFLVEQDTLALDVGNSPNGVSGQPG